MTVMSQLSLCLRCDVCLVANVNVASGENKNSKALMICGDVASEIQSPIANLTSLCRCSRRRSSPALWPPARPSRCKSALLLVFHSLVRRRSRQCRPRCKRLWTNWTKNCRRPMRRPRATKEILRGYNSTIENFPQPVAAPAPLRGFAPAVAGLGAGIIVLRQIGEKTKKEREEREGRVSARRLRLARRRSLRIAPRSASCPQPRSRPPFSSVPSSLRLRTALRSARHRFRRRRSE